MGFRAARVAGCSWERPGAPDTHAGTDTAHRARSHTRSHAHPCTNSGTTDAHAGTHPNTCPHANTDPYPNAGAHAYAGATYSGTAQALRGGAPPDQSQRGSGRARD